MKFINLFVAFTFLVIANMAMAAELGGNCTNSLAAGMVVKSDCSNNSMFEGKQYCFSTAASKMAFDNAPDKSEIVMKATATYNKSQETTREKITQEQAMAQINSASCDLSNKDAGYLQFDNLKLSHCKMVNTSFFGAYLRGADMSGANMQGAYLNLARLEGTNLSGANLTDAIIFQAIFSKTNFKGANLTNARMIGTLGDVNMSDANVTKGRFGLDVGNQPMGQMKFDSVSGNFAHTNFSGADLNIANFSFGNLQGANLSNTNLHRADLSQADLTGADLTGADLTDASVDGAIFTNAKGLDSVKGFATVKGKCVDCKR
ncbi:MAG TPA: pentapeptide repeat-containing protein [Methylophilaceae bacterium]|jgi:uncharacterized protein YjbI with pentapeptide repeats